MTSGSISNTWKCLPDLGTRCVVSITQIYYGTFCGCGKVTVAVLYLFRLNPQCLAYSSVLHALHLKYLGTESNDSFKFAMVVGFLGYADGIVCFSFSHGYSKTYRYATLKNPSYKEQESMTFLLVSYFMPSTMRRWSQLVSQNANWIIIVNANSLWCLENVLELLGEIFIYFISSFWLKADRAKHEDGLLPTE